jgi:PAS domain S-box-containing protein
LAAENPLSSEPSERQVASLADLALDFLSDAVIILDTHNTVVRWNRRAHEMYGWSADEVVGRSIRTVLRGELYLTDDASIIDATVERNGFWSGILLQITRDGREIVVESSVHLMRDADGTRHGVYCVNRDITNQLRPDDQLAMQARLLTNVSDALVMVDTNRKIRFWNAAAEEQYGMSAGEAIGQQLTDAYITLWEYQGEFEQSVAAIATEGRWKGRVRQLTRHGRELYVEATVSAVRNLRGEMIGMLAVLRDVSARVRAEQRLVLLAEVSQTFAAASQNLSTVLDIIAQRVGQFTNDGCAIRLLSDDNSSYNLVTAHYHDEQIRNMISAISPFAVSSTEINRIFAPGSSRGNVYLDREAVATIWRAQGHPDVGIVPELLVLFIKLQARGRLLGVLSLFRVGNDQPFSAEEESLVEDLADRAALAIDNVQTLEIAEHNLALLDTILATAPIGIGFWDEELRCVRINDALASIAELPVAAFQGQSFREIQTTFTREIEPLLVRVLQSGEPIIDYEYTEPGDPALRRRVWTCSIYAMRDLRGQIIGVGVVGGEITARKALEAQLLQSQKMESVGRLAGGIAHDFNNLLTAITGYAELVLGEVDRSSQLFQDVREIQRASSRASNLTRQLLAFARKQIIALQIVDLNQLVAETSRMIGRLIGEDILLTTNLAPGLDAVLADAGQIEQVLVNLAINARDAMPGGGRLMVETANVHLSSSQLSDHAGVVEGLYVMLAVSDTGIGMDQTTRAHAFEPFFTTKPVGTGTGLGLSTCYGIVKQHGGYIWLYSEPGQGTIVRVYLPRSNGDAENQLPAPMSEPTTSGRETILLAEDEESVRLLATRVLRGLGYTVIDASNGAEALRKAQRQQSYGINLLLTDMVMPDMSGVQLADSIREVYPDIRVLYTSGYTDLAFLKNGLQANETRFLQKPFTPSSLAAAIRTTLDD